MEGLYNSFNLTNSSVLNYGGIVEICNCLVTNLIFQSNGSSTNELTQMPERDAVTRTRVRHKGTINCLSGVEHLTLFAGR